MSDPHAAPAGSVWGDFRGHGPQVAGFRRALARGRLASGLLLAGPAGVGKRLFADTLAACLLCVEIPEDELEACGACPSCVAAAAGTHPDLHRVAVPEGKREIPLSAFVGEKEERGTAGLCHALSRRPLLSGRRVAVLEGAEKWTTEAANAFLKTLEEPPGRSVLVLLSDRPESLLPTIRSRVQTVRFGPLPDADVAALLSEHGVAADAAEAGRLAKLARGSLDAAGKLTDPAVRGLREVVRNHVGRGSPAASAKAVVAAVDAAGSDPPSKRAAAGWVLTFCAELFGDRLAGECEAVADGAASPDAPEAAAAALDRIAEAETQIDRYTSAPQVVEALVADLAAARGR